MEATLEGILGISQKANIKNQARTISQDHDLEVLNNNRMHCYASRPFKIFL